MPKNNLGDKPIETEETGNVFCPVCGTVLEKGQECDEEKAKDCFLNQMP